jgi:tetratricopeptide (TPR) repeat protein
VARSHLGQTLQSLGQHERAEAELHRAAEEFEALMALSSEVPDFLRDAGYVHLHLGNLFLAQSRGDDAARAYATARRLWEDAVERWPTPEHRRLLAEILTCCPDAGQRDPTRAREILTAMEGEDSESPQDQLLLGVALTQTAEFEPAIEALRKAAELRLHPDPRDGYYLSLALWQNGDRSGAAEAFHQAEKWLAASRPGDWGLKRLRRDVAETLGLTEVPTRDH